RIMEATEDSNLVHRGGISGAQYACTEAKRLTKDGPASMDMNAVRCLDEEFIRRNLSPGGSADLLAFSVMLYRIKKGNHYD
ncbi:MAG: triphosphoribosyl-dephospho-CoA synthase, partial [Firmicutes bacterium]|nr:triphosphoribosyl-dephospho-CoA synthase [Bacillota bacterium]